MSSEIEARRLEALDRAAIAHRLSDKKCFPNLVLAVRSKVPNKALFMKACDDAGIDATVYGELRDRMWRIIQLTHTELYMQQANGPIW